ncbi:unnamed protein product [Durusdinium trenchii]|uniref:Sfi1 spindle body domain-containing protein n=1 Tax=Durusdinium trenchii TaxID=1381693 RepID=A0ABP0IUQ6_9DINO
MDQRLADALQGLHAAESRLTTVLAQSDARAARENAKLARLRFLGQTLEGSNQLRQLLLRVVFKAWEGRPARRLPTVLLSRKEAQQNLLFLEQFFHRWYFQLRRQQALERLEAAARKRATTLERLREREGVVSYRLAAAMCRVELLHSQRSAEALLRQIVSAWSRLIVSQHASYLEAMAVWEVREEPRGSFSDLRRKESELRGWAELLGSRSQALQRDYDTVLDSLAPHRVLGRNHAVLHLCWQQWQVWRQAHWAGVTQRREESILGGLHLPKVKRGQQLREAWRAWQRLCTGEERPRPMWIQQEADALKNQFQIFSEMLLIRSNAWLLRDLMGVWFDLGCLQPRRERMHARASQAMEADAQTLTSAADAFAEGATSPGSRIALGEATTVSFVATELSWTPLRRPRRTRRSASLIFSLLASKNLWAGKAMLRAWRLRVATERAVNAMLELTLEEGETFLASPAKSPSRRGRRDQEKRTVREVV